MSVLSIKYFLVGIQLSIGLTLFSYSDIVRVYMARRELEAVLATADLRPESRSSRFLIASVTRRLNGKNGISRGAKALLVARERYMDDTGDRDCESVEAQLVVGELEALADVIYHRVKSDGEGKRRGGGLRNILEMYAIYTKLLALEALDEALRTEKFLKDPKEKGRFIALSWVFKRPDIRLLGLLPAQSDPSHYVLTELEFQ